MDEARSTAPSPPAVPLPSISLQSRRRKKGSRRGSVGRGRLIVGAAFFALRALDALIYFGTPEESKTQVMSALIGSALWTTALLVAMIYRQKWARYLLTGLLLLSIIVGLVLLPDLSKQKSEAHGALLMGLFTLTHAAILWALLASPSIRRLTDRISE